MPDTDDDNMSDEMIARLNAEWAVTVNSADVRKELRFSFYDAEKGVESEFITTFFCERWGLAQYPTTPAAFKLAGGIFQRFFDGYGSEARLAHAVFVMNQFCHRFHFAGIDLGLAELELPVEIANGDGKEAYLWLANHLGLRDEPYWSDLDDQMEELMKVRFPNDYPGVDDERVIILCEAIREVRVALTPQKTEPADE